MPKKMPPDNPVSLPAREAFKLYVKEWQERLGMQDWRIVVSDKPSRFAAEVYKLDLEARLATIRLGDDFGSDVVDDTNIEDTAVHELLHILLREFKDFASDPTAKPADTNSAEHRVIHAIVNLLVAK